MIEGDADPDSGDAYRQAVAALYSVAYTLKYTLKRDGALDYPVMPLEGLWWPENPTGAAAPRWCWTVMLLQPDVITGELLGEAVEQAARKRAIPAAGRLRLERFSEGLCAQVLHVGPYEGQGETISALHAFIAEQGYSRRGKLHEIYLGDPRRSAPDRLRTIIRQPVGHAA